MRCYFLLEFSMFIYLLLASNLCALRAPLPRQLVNMPSPKLSALTQASSVVTVKVASLSAAQSNPWFIWSLLFVSSTAGIAAEKTSIGAMLSSPLVTMALTLVMCNVGLLPSVSPIYDTVLKYLVPLAVPLLLLDADLKRCFGSMKQLLKAFFVGALGTVFGTIIAYAMVPMHEIPESINVAAALCGRHIGGAVNFIAISEITKIPSEIVTAAIAADNVVVAIYFALLFTISTPDKISMAEMTSSPRTTALSIPVPSPPKCPFPIFSQVDKNAAKSADEVQPLVDETQSLRNLSTTEVRVSRTETVREGGITLERLLGAVSLSFIICTISQYTGKALSWSPILISSFAAVAAATFFPNVVFPLSKSGGIVGVAFMQLFFSVTGAMGHIPSVLKTAPMLFVHSSVQIIGHYIFLRIVGRSMKIPFRELVLASNANIGGPTTAAAMASNKRWKEFVLPALLTGIFGYAIATPVGLIAGSLLRKLFSG